MNSLTTYLTPSDFSSRLGNISAALTQSEIQPYWVQFRENQLLHLLPDTHAFWAWSVLPLPRPLDAASDLNDALDAALRRWAVYAIWAMYIMQGDAQQTKSGLVVKKTDESDPLSDKQRAELYRKYADMAYKHETTVRDLLLPATASCHSRGRRRSRRVHIVGRNRFDYF